VQDCEDRIDEEASEEILGGKEDKMNPNAIVPKLWNYCNILRDDGLSYQDYIEQLTFLLFLKMADERQSSSRIGPY